MGVYKLKEGVEIYPNGKAFGKITNENLTDAIAEYLLESGKAQESDFESLEKKEKKQNKKEQE